MYSFFFLYEAKRTITGRGFAFGPFFFFAESMYPLNIQLRVELNIQGLATFVTTSSPSSFSLVLSDTQRILIFSRLQYCSSSSTLKNVVLTICFSFSLFVLISSYFSLLSRTSSSKYSTSSTSFLIVMLISVSCGLSSSLKLELNSFQLLLFFGLILPDQYKKTRLFGTTALPRTNGTCLRATTQKKKDSRSKCFISITTEIPNRSSSSL